MVDGGAASDLLRGPRGRRLCAELVPWPGPDGSSTSFAFQAQFMRAESDTERHRLLLAELSRWIPQAWAGGVSTLLTALADTVAWARYWQEPDDVDAALDSAEARNLLLPVARSVAERAPWLWDQMASDDQFVVLSRGLDTFPGDGRGARSGLRRWRDAALAEEARELPADLQPVTAAYSGTWWSTPAMADCPASTRSVPSPSLMDVPLHVLLQEDSLGEVLASARRVRPLATSRVREIRGPSDWVDLVEEYPLVVSRSRAHDWFRATGRVGPWVQPDWLAVASVYEAVHVTVAGYLSTAGQALDTSFETPDGPAGTVMAGWDPDVTWWLGDDLESAGPLQHWRRGDEAVDWNPDSP